MSFSADDSYILQVGVKDPTDECEFLWVDFSPDEGKEGCKSILDEWSNPLVVCMPGNYRLLPNGVFTGVKDPVVRISYGYSK